MRTTWLLVFVCTTAAADDGWRYHSRAAGQRMTNDKIEVPPEPPLASFTTAGTFYLLTVDAAVRPHCQVWTVDPDAKTLSSNGATLALESDGTHLELGGGCAGWMNASDNAAGVDVDGQLWFRDRGACQQALAAHRPVATDLGGCILELPPAAGAQVRATLDRVLVHGGTLFAIVDEQDDTKPASCEPVRADGNSFHHAVESQDWDGHPIHGETTWKYYFTAGANEFSVMDGVTSWSSGSGFGMLCGHDQKIWLGSDWANLGAQYFFSAATCRAEIAKERELASWFAHPRSQRARGIGFGGC